MPPYLLGIRRFRSENSLDYIKIRRSRSADHGIFLHPLGKLTFDDTTRRFVFESDAGDHTDVGYDDVEKVFDITEPMRGGTASQVVSGASLPGMIVGNRIARGHVSSYWLYLEHKDRGRDEPVLLEMPKGSSAQILDRAKCLFGSGVAVTNFSEKGVPINPEDLKARKSSTPRQTVLSRNSRELVTNLMGGSYFADWKVKDK